MGIWRLSRLNLASPVSTSPVVAIRVTRPMVSVVTPSSAARSASGRIMISGFGNRGSLRQPLRIVAGQGDIQAIAARALELQTHARHIPQDFCSLAFKVLLGAA